MCAYRRSNDSTPQRTGSTTEPTPLLPRPTKESSDSVSQHSPSDEAAVAEGASAEETPAVAEAAAAAAGAAAAHVAAKQARIEAAAARDDLADERAAHARTAAALQQAQHDAEQAHAAAIAAAQAAAADVAAAASSLAAREAAMYMELEDLRTAAAAAREPAAAAEEADVSADAGPLPDGEGYAESDAPGRRALGEEAMVCGLRMQSLIHTGTARGLSWSCAEHCRILPQHWVVRLNSRQHLLRVSQLCHLYEAAACMSHIAMALQCAGRSAAAGPGCKRSPSREHRRSRPCACPVRSHAGSHGIVRLCRAQCWLCGAGGGEHPRGRRCGADRPRRGGGGGARLPSPAPSHSFTCRHHALIYCCAG